MNFGKEPIPAHPELANATLSMLELVRACSEVARASWWQLQTAIACQEQLLGNFTAIRRDGRNGTEALKLANADMQPAAPGTVAAGERVYDLELEIARLKEVNAALKGELARGQSQGEPPGWREFIEITAGSGCGVANGVTIASLARKLLVSTANSRRVLEMEAVPVDL
jgi:hypothetical protein